jgi:hypothetical protein
VAARAVKTEVFSDTGPATALRVLVLSGSAFFLYTGVFNQSLQASALN